MVQYIISQALENDKPIEIIYLSDKGITERCIRPRKIQGNILEAYCYLKKSIRRFKIINILSAGYIAQKKVG